MAEKRKALPKHRTPRGVAKYPHLTKPDVKFNAEGEYTTKLVLDAHAAGTVALVDKLTKLRDEAVVTIKAELTEKKKHAEAKSLKVADLPIKPVFDADTGNETGSIEIGFKLKALRNDRDTGGKVPQRPVLFDAKGNVITKTVNVWGGSEIAVSFQAVPYYNAATKSAGITLRLKAVIIYKLVSGSGGTAEDYGFEVDDDGFDANDVPDAADVPPTEAPAASGDGADGDEEF